MQCSKNEVRNVIEIFGNGVEPRYQFLPVTGVITVPLKPGFRPQFTKMGMDPEKQKRTRDGHGTGKMIDDTKYDALNSGE